MFVYKMLKSKKGATYPALFWLFPSGKTYRLHVPPSLVRKMIAEGEVVEYDEVI